MKKPILALACLMATILLANSWGLGQIAAIDWDDTAALKNTMFPKLIENHADISGGRAIFEFNCPLTSCAVGKFFKFDFTVAKGYPIKSYSFFIESEKIISSPIYEFTAAQCSFGNGTFYDCSTMTLKGFSNTTEKYWKKITALTSIPKGTHKMKLEAAWNPSQKIAVDWIPTVEIKKADYPELQKDIIVTKSEWAWWNTSWSRCKPMTINLSTGSATNFTATVNVSYDSDMQADFDDIRFINSASCNTTGNLIGQYQVNKTDSQFANYEILLPSINATVTMYYGNSGASAYSNRRDSNLLWDNFSEASVNSTLWYRNQTAGVTAIESGALSMQSGSTSDAGESYCSVNLYPNPLVIESDFAIQVTGTIRAFEFNNFFTNTGSAWYLKVAAIYSNGGWKATVYNNNITADSTYSNNTWYHVQIIGDPTYASIYSNVSGSMAIKSQTAIGNTNPTAICPQAFHPGGWDVTHLHYDNIRIYTYYTGTVSYSFGAEESNTTTTAPTITITSPTATTYTTTSIWLNTSVNQDAVQEWYSLNGAANVSKTCYQETANVTSACGGLDTGTYASTDWADVINARDGDWSTFGFDNYGSLSINYTKPSGVMASSFWQIKDADGITNVSIPSSCWNFYTSTLAFKVWTYSGNNVSWYCYNGSWNLLKVKTVTGAVYEEAMWWSKNVTITGTQGSNTVIVYGRNTNGLGMANVTFTVDTVAPSITWNTPANNSVTQNVSYIYWNATIGEVPNTCLLTINATANITMSKSGSYCYYNSTGLTNATTYCARIYANDSVGNLNLSGSACATTNLTSFGYFYTQNNPSPKIEGDSALFNLNVTTTQNVTNITAYLLHNGTQYNPAKTIISLSNSYFTYTLSLSQLSNTTQILSFYWNITINNSGSYYTSNSTEQNQTVHKIILTNCSATTESTTKTIWFFIREEVTNNTVAGATLDITFNATATGSLYRSYSFAMNGSDNYSFCLYPAWASYYANIIGQYAATGYSARSYTATNKSLTNSTEIIYLYTQSNATVQPVVITVMDTTAIGLPGIEIQIERYYPGYGIYQSVGSYTTDFSGKTAAYLNLYDVWYRFILLENSTVIATYDPMVITSNTLNFYVDRAAVGEWFNYHDKFTYNCTVSTATNTTTCSIVDTSGLLTLSRLQVTKWNGATWITVCDTNSTSSAATHVCAMGSLSGNLFWYSFTATTLYSAYPLESGLLDFRTRAIDSGNLGVLAAIFILIVCGFMGAFRPSFGLLFAGVGLAISWRLGLLEMSYGSVVAFFVVAGIGIYKMKRGGS